MMREKTILIIDDDLELTELLKTFLQPYGIQCVIANSAREGTRQLKRAVPDLIILDVMLPDQLGFDVCKEIRKNSAVPIVMLSARGHVYDRILGLELGADDYLPKPFEPRELLARVESVLRRQSDMDQPQRLNVGDLSINILTEEVFQNGELLEFTHQEFSCLVYLIRNRHRILGRENLLNELRGLNWDMDNRSMDILISRIRKKLNDDPKSPRHIITIRGSGYRFVGGESGRH